MPFEPRGRGSLATAESSGSGAGPMACWERRRGSSACRWHGLTADRRPPDRRLTVMAGVLTGRAEDFPRWYQDVIAKAELADNGPVRGTMVIRPYGYALWERMQSEVDDRIKAAG